MPHFGTIPSHWFKLDPHSRFDAAFWLAVHDLLFIGHFDPQTATDDQVREAIARVKTEEELRGPGGQED